MTSDLSATPELVCSNPWAPGGVNARDSWPTLPTAVLHRVASPTHHWWSHIPWGGQAGGALRGRWEDFFTFRLFKGKEHHPSDSCPGCLTLPRPRKLWAFRFWESLPPQDLSWFPSWFPTDCPKAPWCSKSRDTEQNFTTTFVAIPSNTLSTGLHIAPADGRQMVLLKVSLTSLLNSAQRLPRKFCQPTPSYI